MSKKMKKIPNRFLDSLAGFLALHHKNVFTDFSVGNLILNKFYIYIFSIERTRVVSKVTSGTFEKGLKPGQKILKKYI